MTEREKMLAGKLYDSSDKELAEARLYARQKTREYNRTEVDEQEKRDRIIKELLGHAGENLFMEPDIRFDYGRNTYIGDNCYFNYNCMILDVGEVRIGDHVMVGPNVSILTPMHPLLASERNMRTDADGRNYVLEYCKPITIGDNVWIGGNVTINGGVTIGSGCVIGSGSVVTRDIPPGVIAAGVPCKVIREITEEDSVEDKLR